ncbi:MAG: response regulator transcription factor [Gammaproteobacteria bacterium]|nr:response regulator transcription factor [Gammaproteobacteria bacterium]
MRLLLVEDDEQLVKSLTRELERAGFVVDSVGNGIDAEFMGNEDEYDLVILDLGLPKRPGLDVLQNWRKAGNQVPVVILTARDSWHERVDGLKAGADDYMGKPFHSEELVARINTIIRRLSGQTGEYIEACGLRLDDERQVVLNEQDDEITLTATEFRLLRYFMLNPGKPLSKTRLIDHVYEQDFDRESNLIEVYIRRLRDKVGKDRIKTQRGQGYLLVDAEQ